MGRIGGTLPHRDDVSGHGEEVPPPPSPRGGIRLSGKPRTSARRQGPGRWRRWRGTAIAASLRLLALTLQPLHWHSAQALGRQLGRAAWVLARRDRRRAVDHLALAFPEHEEHQRRQIARDCFLHLGTSLAEMLYLSRRKCPALLQWVRLAGWEHIETAQKARRPIILLTGHCGNWELFGAALCCLGLPLTVVGRRMEEEPLNALVLEMRQRFGARTLERGTPRAPRRLLEALRRGSALGLLIDQDTRVDGVWVPFFGRLAYTPLGAAKIALSQHATVIPGFIERLADGSHLARVLPPMELQDDPLAATAAMTALIEEQIRHVPEQWVWMHRRWRRQPGAEG